MIYPVDKLFDELYSDFKDLIHKNILSKGQLKGIEAKLEALYPVLREMVQSNKVLDRSKKEGLTRVMESGIKLFGKCSKTPWWNTYKRYKYANKLIEWENILKTVIVGLDVPLTEVHYQGGPRTEDTFSEWIVIVISLCLEGLSLACDQNASPRKPYYGLIGMLLALVALLVSIWEFLRKGVKLRRFGVLWWTYHPHSHSSIYGTLPDIYGIFGGLAQFVCSAVQYAYLLRHANSPIQASLLPAIFLLCLGSAKLTESRTAGTSDDERPHICQICRICRDRDAPEH